MQNYPTPPQATSPLVAWLDYIEHLHGQEVELGLERINQVANQLALLKPAPRVFTVAGTNGKGTTCRTLEAILLAAGLRVGVYSSPHLQRYTERVRIQGEELPESQHAQAFAYLDAGRGDTSLTYFEFGTLAALYLFKQAQLDVVILEVGLGGRLDATNIVDADVAVVTSIALDHMDWLGDNRESIGREKAGIFRHGKPAVVGEPDMPQSMAEVAAECGASLYRRHDNVVVDIEDKSGWRFTAGKDDWCWETADCRYQQLPLPQVPLANAATALAALYHSGMLGSSEVSRSAIEQGLHDANLPGRFQIVQQHPTLILDVAHNPHAATYLASRLAQLPTRPGHQPGKVRAVIGMLADKDITGTLASLSPQVDEWYCASLQGPRAASAQQLADCLPQPVAPQRLFATVQQAWHQAMQDAAISDTIIVCGSFYTVAHVLTALERG